MSDSSDSSYGPHQRRRKTARGRNRSSLPSDHKRRPGYFDRLADRVLAEAEGGGITMKELLGMPPADGRPVVS
jgi:hypothetical protein